MNNELELLLLDKTEEAFHGLRKDTIKCAAYLYECVKDEVWRARYDTQGEFVESLGLSQSGASKLLTVFSHYVIGGAVSQDKLAGTDMEKLYLAKSLEGTPEEQFAKAELLSRQEIKAQKVFEKEGHECEHLDEIRICKNCHQRLG